MIGELREKVVSKFMGLLYEECGGDSIDSHHAFIVSYKQGEDVELNFHYDASEVTINVCLGKTFTGGELYFKGILHKPQTHKEHFIYSHKPGFALLHEGKHRHGALPILSGERHNLIIWFKSTLFQQNQTSCFCPHHHHQQHQQHQQHHHHHHHHHHQQHHHHHQQHQQHHHHHHHEQHQHNFEAQHAVEFEFAEIMDVEDYQK